jgi:hypothetical protein
MPFCAFIAERNLLNLVPNTAARAGVDVLQKRTGLTQQKAKIVGGGRYMSSLRVRCRSESGHDQVLCALDGSDPLFRSILAPYKDFRTANFEHEGIEYCRYSSEGIETRFSC